MLKMIDALDKFVTLDIPFLITERTERVDNLKSIMDRGDISTSEKFRKVTEAYQIESDYGRTIEAYRSEVEFDGETFNADFLRVGRVSLHLLLPVVIKLDFGTNQPVDGKNLLLPLKDQQLMV